MISISKVHVSFEVYGRVYAFELVSGHLTVVSTVIVWVYSINGTRTRPQGVAVQSISKYFGRNALWLAVAPGHAVGVNGHASNQPAWL